jgi:2-iminobutanoate/2-iminopropanoate deaminase
MRRVALGVDPVEPYSKIIKADGFIHIKSHCGLDFDTGEIVDGGIGEQTRVTLEWLRRALEKAGGDMADLVKINVYMSDIDADFDGMNAAYDAYLLEAGLDKPPARTTVGVPLSWPGLLVQMDALAAGG